MTKSANEISEREFLSFVYKIHNDEYKTEKEHIDAILEFKTISEHPAGSDLIFYPEPGKSGPEAIVAEIKAWRAANGKPGFKPV